MQRLGESKRILDEPRRFADEAIFDRLGGEDVVTLATPHGGVGVAYLCGSPSGAPIQCIEMRPGSPTLVWMDDNPQSDGIGTDWTLVGSSMDGVVSPESAFNMCCAGHKVRGGIEPSTFRFQAESSLARPTD